jgi:putative membrane protein
MKILVRLAVNVFALFVVEYLVPGFTLASFWTAVVAAIVIGVINTFIKPIVQLIALPVSILTFGITAFLVNVFLLWLASVIVPGFIIAGFWTAVAASIVLALTSWFLNSLSSDR